MAALIVHFTHERNQNPGATRLKATHRQLLDLMRDRCGVEVDLNKFWRLLHAYADGNHPARKISLLRRVFEGRREEGERAGKPSEYELLPEFVALLDLGTPAVAPPAPAVALPASEPAGSPARTENAPEAKRKPESDKGEGTMARARELGIAVKQPEAPATIRFPAKKGLTDIIIGVMQEGGIGPSDLGRIQQTLAEMMRRHRAEEGT